MFKILIVEDDSTTRWNIKTLLSDTYLVFESASAKDAVLFFQNHEVDLCIIDVGLPDSNGYDLCKIIRTMSTIPIIFVTVEKTEELISKCHALCVQGIVFLKIIVLLRQNITGVFWLI